MRRELLVAGKYLAGLAMALVLFVGSVALSFLLIGRHFGARLDGLPAARPGPAANSAATCWWPRWPAIGYGAVFLMCGLFFRNPMIPAAVVWVWENLNPFLPALLKKISVIFYLKNLCPVEVPIPPPFNVMVVEADPTPVLDRRPRPAARSPILLVYSAHFRAAYGNQLRGVSIMESRQYQ